MIAIAALTSHFFLTYCSLHRVIREMRLNLNEFRMLGTDETVAKLTDLRLLERILENNKLIPEKEK